MEIFLIHFFRKLSNDNQQLQSIQNILAEIERDTHAGLTKMFQEATYVGYISAELSLLQYETKLFVVHMRNASSAFMYQVFYCYYYYYYNILTSCVFSSLVN